MLSGWVSEKSEGVPEAVFALSSGQCSAVRGVVRACGTAEHLKLQLVMPCIGGGLKFRRWRRRPALCERGELSRRGLSETSSGCFESKHDKRGCELISADSVCQTVMTNVVWLYLWRREEKKVLQFVRRKNGNNSQCMHVGCSMSYSRRWSSANPVGNFGTGRTQWGSVSCMRARRVSSHYSRHMTFDRGALIDGNNANQLRAPRRDTRDDIRCKAGSG